MRLLHLLYFNTEKAFFKSSQVSKQEEKRLDSIREQLLKRKYIHRYFEISVCIGIISVIVMARLKEVKMEHFANTKNVNLNE